MKNPFERRMTPPIATSESSMNRSDEEQQLQQQMLDADQRLNEYCLAIGKAYLERHRNDYEPAFSNWMQSIFKTEQEKQEYKQKWMDLKGIVICDRCGAESPKEARYCGNCGERLFVSHSEEVPKGFRQCAHCGQIQDEKIRFCMNCGASMEDEAPSSPVRVTVEPTIAAVGESPSTASQNHCPNCGAVVDAGAVFCSECGISLVPTPSEERYCPNCHAPIEEGAMFCTECGAKL